MATPSKNMDRRAERTRQMLQQAFLEVTREKGVMTVSVQEIADRANVSRGTFYAHYPDKYALIETILREGFQEKLSALSGEAGWNRDTLQALIQIVLDYFKAVYQRHRYSPEIGPILERVVHEELNSLILAWLKEQKQAVRSGVSAETIVQVASWAIFGAALHWSRDNHSIPAEQMARDILAILMDGIARLVPDG